MKEDGIRDLASRLGLIPIGEKRQTLPVDPQIWRRAYEAHVSEQASIYTRLVKREIDRDEAKRQLSDVLEKVRGTYFALVKEEKGEQDSGG